MPVWQHGDWVSLAQGLGSPQSPALQCQAPWDGPPRGRPRVRVSPQEARRPQLKAVQRAEQRAKVRMLGMGSMGPRILHGVLSNVSRCTEALPVLTH